jgi:hypothetical protein
MTDPRFTDPRYSDPRYSDPQLFDPVLPRDDGVGGTWGWFAGIVVVALIAFLVIAGMNGNSNTASDNPSPAATVPGNMSPPSTTGSGASSPRPPMPAPTMPAPSKSGTQ